MLNTLRSYTEKDIIKSFSYGENKIDSTRQYKYLGLLITPSGEINSGLKDLKDRALRAFIKSKKKMGLLFQQFPFVSLKLFDTL